MMFNLRPWEIIGAIQVAFYVIITLITVYPSVGLIRNRSPFRWFFIRYTILMLSKITGGILLIIYKNNYTNVNLAVATSVLNSISLAFLTMLLAFSTRFAETYRNPEQNKKNGGFLGIYGLIHADYTKSASWDNLLEKLTFVTMILNIVGNSMVGSDRATSKPIQEAGSIIYLVCLVLIGALVFHKIMKEKRQADQEYGFILGVLTICAILLIFILIRMIYGVCYAFTFNVDGTYTTNVSKFTFLFGDWKYYAFIAFIEECICVALYALMIWVVFNGENKLIHLHKSTDTTEDYQKFDA